MPRPGEQRSPGGADEARALREVLDAVVDGYWEHDVAAGRIRWSPSLQRIFGLPAAPVPDRLEPLWARVEPVDRARLVAAYEDLLQTEGQDLLEDEVCARDGDGRSRHYHLRLRCLARGPGGGARRAIGALTDITRRRQAELTLRESEARFARLADAAPDPIVMVDAAGRIEYWNAAAERTFGYPAREVEGMDLHRLLAPPRYHGAIAEGFTAFSGSGRGPVVDGSQVQDVTALRRRPGSPEVEELPVQISVAPVRIGDGWHAVGVLRDVTQQRGLEQALLERGRELSAANAELRHAARLKDEFLATVSHELRTPLNTVLTLAEVLQDQLYGPLTPKQIDYLATMEGSGRHLLALLNDILDLAKLGAGSASMDEDDFDAAEVCTASLSMVREEAERKGLRLASRLPSAPVPMRADARRLKQVVINLLANAVKFTPDGGEVELTLEADPEVVRFAVRDTGPGIPQADQARLFEPFVQLEGGLTRSREGSGLGLALVERLTALHGGCVHLESSPGAGSRFVVAVPRIHPAPPGPGLPERLAADAPRLLLVSDRPARLEALALGLRQAGLRTAWALPEELAGHEGLQPDAVVLDLPAPAREGLTAVRRVRALPGLLTTPVVAASGLMVAGWSERCAEAGAAACLPRPLSADAVLAALAGAGVRLPRGARAAAPLRHAQNPRSAPPS